MAISLPLEGRTHSNLHSKTHGLCCLPALESSGHGQWFHGPGLLRRQQVTTGVHSKGNCGTAELGRKEREGKRQSHYMLQDSTQRPPAGTHLMQVLLFLNSFTLVTFKMWVLGDKYPKWQLLVKVKRVRSFLFYKCNICILNVHLYDMLYKHATSPISSLVNRNKSS